MAGTDLYDRQPCFALRSRNPWMDPSWPLMPHDRQRCQPFNRDRWVGGWFSPMKSTPFLRDHLKGRPPQVEITNLQRANRSVKTAKLRGGPGRDRKHHFDLFGWFQKARYCDSKPKPHIKPLWIESQKIVCLKPSLDHPCGPVYVQCIIAIVAIVEDLWWNATCVIRSPCISEAGHFRKARISAQGFLRSKISWDKFQNASKYRDIPGYQDVGFLIASVVSIFLPCFRRWSFSLRPLRRRRWETFQKQPLLEVTRRDDGAMVH